MVFVALEPNLMTHSFLQNLMTVECLSMFSTAPPLPHSFPPLPPPAVSNHKLAPTFPGTKVSFGTLSSGKLPIWGKIFKI